MNNDYQLLMVTSKKAIFKYNGQVQTEPLKKNAEGLLYHAILNELIILPKQFQRTKPRQHYLTNKKTPCQPNKKN